MSSGSKSSAGGGFLMPPQQNLPGGFAGTGPQMPYGNPQTLGRPGTGNGLTPPDWATNWFAMPWWGQPAPNVGAALWQQMHPEMYQDMRRLQNKRAPAGKSGRKRKRQRRQEQGPSGYDVYRNPDRPSGYGDFLSSGPFGGRRR